MGDSFSMVQAKSPTSSTTPGAIAANVRRLYERYPYPHYPLLATPRLAEAWLISSAFATRLNRSGSAVGTPRVLTHNPLPEHVLIAGSGEILPWIVRRWERNTTRVTAVDLSGQSLRRARFRTCLTRGALVLHQGDIQEFLTGAAANGAAFSHVECYGMLHHLAQPDTALRKLHDALYPGGSMRVMVYNARARRWIHLVQDLFGVAGLALDPHSPADVMFAGQLLELLGGELPALRARITAMGRQVLTNTTRFADTFLHPHELRWDIAQWFAEFAAAGFHVRGLFDRYGELDDLHNPMWQAPTAEELTARAEDLRFENNLELFLGRSSDLAEDAEAEDKQTSGAKRPRVFRPVRLRFSPPRRWFDYTETRQVPALARHQLWGKFLAHLSDPRDGGWSGDDLRKDVGPLRTLQRLARLGAILPRQISDGGLARALREPMVSHMDPPQWPQNSAHDDRAIAALALALQARLAPTSHPAISGLTTARLAPLVTAKY